MAYSAITDTEILPGKPGSNSLFTRLRDNPIAIAQGLSGAPKILDAAFSTNSVNANKLVNLSVGANQVANNVLEFTTKLKAYTTYTAYVVPASTVWYLPAGIYTGTFPYFEYWNGAAWNSVSGAGATYISNGGNYRVNNVSIYGVNTYRYRIK